ncbi:MAG: glycosyltransferase [Betaproteobacteria bacterium]|nr:glycosyltransferase [Betaproteobacteria bacterium]
MLAEDSWRLENNFFGTALGPDEPFGTALFLGARSGLEILRLLERAPQTRIVVVEPKAFLRGEVAACIGAQAGNRLLIVASLSEAFPARAKIGYARVDIGAFDWETVQNLLTQHEVAHIAGEFDSADAAPLELIRFCRRHAGRFFWRMSGHETPLSGRGGSPEIEVSVVVPCYKVLAWVDHCMDTLVRQSIESLEIIAVDDGSPDETGARLDEWATRFPGRIRVIHKPNGGCASARNAGLMAARGEYVGFVDGDDWVETPMFEALYTSATLHAAEISQCGYTEVYEATGTKADFPTAWGAKPRGMLGLAGSPRDFLSVKPTIWRRLYRRDFLLGNGIKFPEHIRRFDDLPFQFEALSCAKRMSILPDCYYNYRLERAGQDVAARDVKLFVHFPIFDWLEEHVGTWADAELERALFATKLNTHLWALTRMSNEFAGRYKALAAHDIFRHRRYMSPLQMLALAARRSPRTALFVAQAWLRAKTAPPAMIASD